MLKVHRLILIFNLGMLFVCLFFGYRYFVMSSRLVGNNVVYIVLNPDRHSHPMQLSSVRYGMDTLYDYNIAKVYRKSGIVRNGSRFVNATVSFTNSVYFTLQNHMFLHGGGWFERFDNDNIIVLSENLAWALFGNLEVLSLHVEIEGQFFEVSGIIRQKCLDEPSFAWIPYNHYRSEIINITGVYIGDRGSISLERRFLAERFITAAELAPANLRIIDLDQYSYNIFVRFNLFVMVIAGLGVLFFVSRFLNALEVSDMRKSLLYFSLTIALVLLCAVIWQNTALHFPPAEQAFGAGAFIDNIFNAHAFNGVSNLSHTHQTLYEFNRSANFSLIIGSFALANIIVIGALDIFSKRKENIAQRPFRSTKTIPQYIIIRLLQFIPAFIIMTFIIFYAMLLMPTPGQRYFPPDAHIRYIRFILSMLHGDFGISTGTGLREGPISELLLSMLPNTAALVLGAIIVSGVSGVVLGIKAAIKQNKFLDHIIMVSTLFASSIPVFFLAAILLMIFTGGHHIGWNPRYTTIYDWRTMVLPIISLAVPSIAFIARTTRTALLDIMRAPYVVAARARGLPEKAVITHAVSNMRVPIINSIALQLVELFMNTVIVEMSFGIWGLGSNLIWAINFRQPSLIMSIIIVLSVICIIINLAVDILCVIVVPKAGSKL